MRCIYRLMLTIGVFNR